MRTTRLSLIKEDEIVLIGGRYDWSAFQITKHHNDYVTGVWLSDGVEAELAKGLPTKVLDRSWVMSEIVKLNTDISNKKKLLEKLYKLEK